MIRLSKSSISEAEVTAVKETLLSERLGMGTEVEALEEELQKFIKTTSSVVCVNSGTAALHLAVQALGIGSSDEVIVPTLTYVASFQAVSATGARAVACDIDLKTGFIDLKSMEKLINNRTKAVMPVHYASNFADIEKVYKVANKYNLRVIEDAAHSFGGENERGKVGSFGDIVCFSFDGIKNITCGEGGAIVTGDKTVLKKIRDSRLLGVVKDSENRYQNKRSWDFDVLDQGWRMHMSNIMASIGRVQLKRLSQFSLKRQHLVKRYLRLLEGIDDIKPLHINYKGLIPHIFPVRVLNGKRDDLRAILSDKNIETGIHYKPNHLHKLYQQNLCELRNSETFYKQALSLPLHTDLLDEDVNKIVKVIKSSMKEFS